MKPTLEELKELRGNVSGNTEAEVQQNSYKNITNVSALNPYNQIFFKQHYLNVSNWVGGDKKAETAMIDYFNKVWLPATGLEYQYKMKNWHVTNEKSGARFNNTQLVLLEFCKGVLINTPLQQNISQLMKRQIKNLNKELIYATNVVNPLRTHVVELWNSVASHARQMHSLANMEYGMETNRKPNCITCGHKVGNKN